MKRSFLGSQSSLLKTRPLVVGTLTHALPLAAQIAEAKRARVDMVELRLDGFAHVRGPFQKAQEFGRNVIREIKSKTKLPVLLTFRASAEQGIKRSGPAIADARRAEILARLLPSVEMIDVEIRRAEFARRMTVIAHVQGVNVIHSAHNFTGPGNVAQLKRLSEQSLKLKGDIFKIAVTPRDNDDLEKFMKFGLLLRNPRKVLIGMGPVGLISRVIGFCFGSILTYGHLGHSAAPGQIPAGNLMKAVRDVTFAR